MSFSATIGTETGPTRNTPIGAMHAAYSNIKPNNGPIRIVINENGSPLMTVHGQTPEHAIVEAQTMIKRNRRHFG